MRNLFTDYVSEAPDLMAFFARPCKTLGAIPPQTAPWDPALVKELGAYQKELGNSPHFSGNEAVIITGQQPGLFTGPLYTIYKAATTIVLARRLQAQSGTPYAPIFWVASDDHDFEESRTANLLTPSHEILSLLYAPDNYLAGQPMNQVPIEHSLHDLVEEAATHTRGSEFRAEIVHFLHESIEQSTSLANWTARLIARLFRDTPLTVFTPELPSARELAAPIFEQELDNPLSTTALINETGQRLRKHDFAQQITKHPNECCFFLAMGDRRRKVLFENGVYVLPEENLHFSASEIRKLLQDDPSRFTPNVALRCVVQQQLFPVEAYVAGPGELAYWAQLKPVFEHFGKEMPVVYPRAQCALVDAKMQDRMAQFRFTRDDLTLSSEQLLARALQVTAQTPALDIVRQYRERVSATLTPLSDELKPLNTQVAQMAGKMIDRFQSEFDRLERALARDDEVHMETIRKQIARLTVSLYPTRRPQERVLNIFSFLFEHGWDLIPRLIEEIDVDAFTTKEIVL